MAVRRYPLSFRYYYVELGEHPNGSAPSVCCGVCCDVYFGAPCGYALYLRDVENLVFPSFR